MEVSMRSLRVTILDLVTKGPTDSLYSRVMNPNLASIMPQVVGVWCEELGHQVRFVCYTGREDLHGELLNETDIVFIGAFTRSALTAYAISNLFRARGAVTVLGGPMRGAIRRMPPSISTMWWGLPTKPDSGYSGRLCAASSDWGPARRGTTADRVAGSQGTVEIHRADHRQGSHVL